MIKNYLIDIEGVVIKDKTFTPVTGSIEWFEKIKKEGKKFLLATNNTTHNPENLIKALNESGFEFNKNHLVTCLMLALDEMRDKNLKSCYVLASDSVKDYLKSNDIEIKENGCANAVIVGLDLTVNYKRLKTAVETLLNGASLISLHENRLYRDIDGKYSVSAGGITRALEYTVHTKSTVVGKPSTKFYKKCLKKIDALPEETMFISDDPFSDLTGAKDNRMKTCFVLSGKYSSKDILNKLEEQYQPDYVYNNISELS